MIYTLYNVEDDYEYSTPYKSVQDTFDVIAEYETEDLEERKHVNTYEVLDDEGTAVYNSLDGIDNGAYYKDVLVNVGLPEDEAERFLEDMHVL